MFRVAVLKSVVAFALLVAGAAGLVPGVTAAERWAYIDVVGAPGDGKEALENALSNQLLHRVFTVMGTPSAEAYEIQGMVRLFPAGRGEETIRIDWTIFGPEGMRLGNVTQTNIIRKGSLNRHWGDAADAAASAVAEDILQYMSP